MLLLGLSEFANHLASNAHVHDLSAVYDCSLISFARGQQLLGDLRCSKFFLLFLSTCGCRAVGLFLLRCRFVRITIRTTVLLRIDGVRLRLKFVNLGLCFGNVLCVVLA